LFVVGVVGLTIYAAPVIDEKLNAVTGTAIPISEHARKLHRSLLIIDLHADSLLWDRNLLIRNHRGHVDIPRLVEGNVALQAFTIVSKVPHCTGKANGIDQIGLLSVAERWPPSTWTSLKERVIYQTQKLQQFAEHSNGKFALIKTVGDLDNYLRRRQSDPSLTAGFLGVEGAHALEGDLNNVDVFFDHGVRMMAPTHFFDNDIGGSSQGDARTGLTNLGKEMIRKMQAQSMIVDLAHASSATIRDALAISTKPVVVSHTGVKGTCDSARNLSDADIVGVAKNGGVVGIGYWPEAVCGRDTRDIARAIRYAVDLAGIDHVALGSDFDGDCSAPFDASGLVSVTQALIDQHFTDKEIRAIMGENALRVLRSGLPGSSVPGARGNTK
jgi:microsomal dipeptidase-like Zn-dependent dipeptidase